MNNFKHLGPFARLKADPRGEIQAGFQAFEKREKTFKAQQAREAEEREPDIWPDDYTAEQQRRCRERNTGGLDGCVVLY